MFKVFFPTIAINIKEKSKMFCKAFTVDRINVQKMKISDFDMVKSFVRKPAFPPFPNGFHKTFSTGSLKV